MQATCIYFCLVDRRLKLEYMVTLPYKNLRLHFVLDAEDNPAGAR